MSVILGDKIDPNSDLITVPHTTPQLEKKDARFLNKHIHYRKITVEHAIADMKVYRVISSIWRHPRPMLSIHLYVQTLCAGSKYVLKPDTLLAN